MLASQNVQVRRCGHILAAFILLSAQGLASAQSPPATPTGLLKWSMTKYAETETFQADCHWNADANGAPSGTGAKRTFWYQKPNLFKVITTHGGTKMVQTSVSDGSKLVEFTTGVEIPALSYDAPASLADANTMQMGHPMFNGSLLYQFFGGPEKYSALVDERKMLVSFGPMVNVDGEKCRTVKFWARGSVYGRTEVAIGISDGLVRRIRYGSEPLIQMMQSGMFEAEIKKAMQSPEFKKQGRKGRKGDDAKAMQNALNTMKKQKITMQTTENYVHIAVGKPIESTVFTAAPPKGQQVQELSDGSAPQPPVALGKPAPEISVVGVDGVKRTLADFRGSVVLIDFWATWCPPCRKGLPETQRFHTDYGKKGLAVLTISDEDKATVLPFIKQNKYTFPVYLDAGGVTNKAYNISAIPTVVVIDREGKLAAYRVGLASREEILDALKQAGLATE